MVWKNFFPCPQALPTTGAHNVADNTLDVMLRKVGVYVFVIHWKRREGFDQRKKEVDESVPSYSVGYGSSSDHSFCSSVLLPCSFGGAPIFLASAGSGIVWFISDQPTPFQKRRVALKKSKKCQKCQRTKGSSSSQGASS